MEVIKTDLTTVGGRIWAVRDANGLSRRAFAERLGALAAWHGPVIDGFSHFLRGRTPEQLEFIARQLRECVDCIEQMQKDKD